MHKVFYPMMCQTLLKRGLVGQHSSIATAQTHQKAYFLSK